MRQESEYLEHPAPRPFWLRLNTFFAFPFQFKPLGYAVLLSLCSLLPFVLFQQDPQLLLVSFTVVMLGIFLAISRYGFKVMVYGSRGIVRTADFPSSLEDEWTALPWKLFLLLGVQGGAAGLVAEELPNLLIALQLLISFTLPATMMTLVLTGSFFQSLNPLRIGQTMHAIGWPYLLLVFFLGLLNFGMAYLIQILGVQRKPDAATLPLVFFVMIYFSWVMSSLLGYAMYQNHEELDIDLLPNAGADDRVADTRTPEQIAQQRSDKIVAEMVTDGDLAGAFDLAYEEQRLAPESLAAQRRYHRVLLFMPDKKAVLLDHAHRLIALLLRNDQSSEALKVYKACRERDTGFALDDPQATMTLARIEWRGGDARAALALLSGFDKRFRGHESIPQAYELAARVLVQGLQRPDMAQPILATLEARYPTSEATQEVKWLLRDQPSPL